MDKLVITAAAKVSGDDLRTARLGARFGRMDLPSRLCLLAVESLGVDYESLPGDRVAICLATKTGSLPTDADYWQARDDVGGPSPTLFTYTLPSAPIGEIAIRHRLTGPNLCLVGDGDMLLAEVGDMIRRGEADACICIHCQIVTNPVAKLVEAPLASRACAVFLGRGGGGMQISPEIDRDMEALCDRYCAQKSATRTKHASIA